MFIIRQTKNLSSYMSILISIQTICKNYLISKISLVLPNKLKGHWGHYTK